MDQSSSDPSDSSDEIYKTESSSDSEGEIPDLRKRVKINPRSSNKIAWVFVKEFESVQLAQEALKKEGLWSINFTYHSDTLMKKKIYYRCNQARKRGAQCPAKRHLEFSCGGPSTALLWRSDAEHDHHAHNNNNYNPPASLTDEVKLQIDKLTDVHMKPRDIMTALSKIEGIQLPTMNQLRFYLSERKRTKCEETVLLDDVHEWLLINTVVCEYEHQAFVIASEISTPKSIPAFRFVLSTKTLLKLGLYAKVIHASCPTKLVWQGFPVTIIGTTDKDQRCHPLCLAVTVTERIDDYEMIFRALKDAIRFVHESEFAPEVLVTDASENIKKAFNEVFKDAVVRTCWTSVKRKLHRYIDRCVTKSLQKEVWADLEVLHSVTNPHTFDLASKFFLQKYESEKVFIRHFQKCWLEKDSNWYLGAVPGTPPNNKVYDYMIKAVRDSKTLRQCLPLPKFLEVVLDMVSDWSANYADDLECYFATKHSITLRKWADSYVWSKMTKEIIVTHKDERNTYFDVPAGNAETCKYYDRQPENFDEFKEQYFSIWYAALPLNPSDWMSGECTCPMYYKKYMCEHVIGLSIRMEYAFPPDDAKNLAIGIKKKMGRPPKKPAILI